MTDRAAILACVAENPMDRLPRLIAADWFEEFGDTIHAEQLRICALSYIPCTYFRFARYGYGDGYGYGLFPTLKGGGTMPEVGKNQLIVLAHGWVICGFVEEQPGPFQFRVTNAVVICRTGGVPWDELADGKRRGEATYRKWGSVLIGPQFVLSREWKGELP